MSIIRNRVTRKAKRFIYAVRPYQRVRMYKDRSLEFAWEKTYELPLIKKVQIQTHSRCNADCLFCPYSESWHAKNHGRMSDELFERVLNELLPFSFGINRGNVCPYLMQEPLVDLKIFNQIEKIYDYFPNTLVEISTNGLALRDKVVTKLLEILTKRRHEIWISHHGIDKETMEHIMKIDYDIATRNLINLLKRADGRLRIKLRGAGTSRSGQIRYFDSEQYIKHWNAVFEREGINRKNIIIMPFTFHDRAGTIHRSDRNANINKVGIVRQIDAQHPFYCNRIDEWIHIMYDGTIRICCMDYHGEVELPNLSDMGLVEYIRSPAYKNLVDMVTGKVESPDDFICKRCISPGG